MLRFAIEISEILITLIQNLSLILLLIREGNK